MKTFPHTTPTGHTYHEPTDWKQLCEWSMNRAQGSMECWDDAELPPDETPAMFTIAWNTAVRAREALEQCDCSPGDTCTCAEDCDCRERDAHIWKYDVGWRNIEGLQETRRDTEVYE
jgi:hypothetical protein